MLVYTLVSGVLYGLYFSLVGLGLNLVFGVLRMVNLAHGDFLMLGAFGAYFAYSLWGLNPLAALVVLAAGFALLGIGLYHLLLKRVSGSRDPEMLSLILFFGLSQVIQSISAISFSNNPRSIAWSALGTSPVPILGQTFEESWVIGAMVSAAGILFIYVYLYRTKWGYATRAVMGDREEAASSGIRIHRVSAAAFGIGLATAAAAGALAPFFLGAIVPGMGTDITTTAFAVIVAGSLGNPLGTVAGGILFGLSSMYMQSYDPSWSNLVPYLILFVVLLVRPGGLFGKAVRNA